MSKHHTPLCLLLSFCTIEYLVSITINGNAQATDNLAPLDMSFLSIIAYG